jgi:hypothetical protein
MSVEKLYPVMVIKVPPWIEPRLGSKSVTVPIKVSDMPLVSKLP